MMIRNMSPEAQALYIKCLARADIIEDVKMKAYAFTILTLLKEQYVYLNQEAIKFLYEKEDPMGYLIEISGITGPNKAKSSVKKTVAYNIRTGIKSAIMDSV